MGSGQLFAKNLALQTSHVTEDRPRAFCAFRIWTMPKHTTLTSLGGRATKLFSYFPISPMCAIVSPFFSDGTAPM